MDSRVTRNDFTVRTQSFGKARPPGVGQERVKNPRFFDVKVTGVSGVKAAVWITHDAVTRDHMIHHWDGKKWVLHPEKTVSGKTIRAEFKVSELRKTPIVIGT